MRPAKDCTGTDLIRISETTARIRMRTVEMGGRWIRNARTQRHVWAPRIVMCDPLFIEIVFAKERGSRHLCR